MINGDGSAKLENYNFSLDTVWNTAFDTLKKKNANGKGFWFQLLGIMAYLSPDHVPNTLFDSTRLSQVPHTPAFWKDENEYEVFR